MYIYIYIYPARQLRHPGCGQVNAIHVQQMILITIITMITIIMIIVVLLWGNARGQQEKLDAERTSANGMVRPTAAVPVEAT